MSAIVIDGNLQRLPETRQSEPNSCSHGHEMESHLKDNSNAIKEAIISKNCDY